MRWARLVAPIGEMRNAYEILVGKFESKRSHGRSRRTREDDIIKLFLGKYGGKLYSGWIWLRIETSGSSCGYDN
jgi:hypothetical protein